MRRQKIAIIGYGQRGRIYGTYAINNPNEFEVVAIVDNDINRLNLARNEHKCPLFENIDGFLENDIKADIVAICVQDKDHCDYAIKCMEHGYDLLLEKPIASSLEDCEKIYECSKKNNRKVVVCHVLRYSPFFKTLKELIDEGKLGNIISINIIEHVGYYHHAHSFVRGPWRNTQMSSPMILAKCCHDLDILRWLIGDRCTEVVSYGSLSYFNADNAPLNSANYCTDCKILDCKYSAKNLYEQNKWMRAYFCIDENDDKLANEKLKYSQYDKCVFKCDNDVVDNQNSIFKFKNGVVATQTMVAFSKEIYREIKIFGTKAELFGNMEKNIIELRVLGGDVVTYNIDKSLICGNHGGGDSGLMHDLYLERNGEKPNTMTYLDVSIESHRMAFAAEKSRVKNIIVRI